MDHPLAFLSHPRLATFHLLSPVTRHTETRRRRRRSSHAAADVLCLCLVQCLVYSTRDLSLMNWSPQWRGERHEEGEGRGERPRDQKQTDLVVSRANREDKEAGEQGLQALQLQLPPWK